LPASLEILIASPDPKLREDVETAVESLAAPPLVRTAAGPREALSAARDRSPAWLLLELGPDPTSAIQLVRDLETVSPETRVAAVLADSLAAADVAESEIMIAAIRAGVQDFLRQPISSHELEQLLERGRRSRAAGPQRAGKIVSFVSTKGGVGKSTLAVNVAAGLAARHPGRVLLVDVSLQLGVAATMLDLRTAATLTDVARERERLDETLVTELATQHPCGLHLLAAPADAIEATHVDDEVISRVLTLARRAYDYVIVDTFPFLDPVMVSILDLSDRGYVIIEPTVPTLLGAARLLQVLDNLGFERDRRRVILNRYAKVAGGLTPTDAAQRLGESIQHVVPYNRRVLVAANTGQPLALNRRRFSRLDRALDHLIADVETLAHENEVLASSNGRANRSPHGAPSADEANS